MFILDITSTLLTVENDEIVFNEIRYQKTFSVLTFVDSFFMLTFVDENRQRT